jgi:biopolymer transport protein ExbD
MRYFDVRRPRIEIIPMIDIMLFLLVFFIMMTIHMIPSKALTGTLPSSTTADSIKQVRVLVEIHPNGVLIVDQVPMRLDALRAKLQPLGSKTVVTVAGAADTSMQDLANVMDSIRSAGIHQIGLATRNVP